MSMNNVPCQASDLRNIQRYRQGSVPTCSDNWHSTVLRYSKNSPLLPSVTPLLSLSPHSLPHSPFSLHSHLPPALPSPLTHHSAIARARQGVIADAMADTLTINPHPRPFSKPSGPSPPKSSSSSSSGQPSPEQQRVTITLKDPKPFPSKVATAWNVRYQKVQNDK